jgi:linoleoyl-CoA desaturase
MRFEETRIHTIMTTTQNGGASIPGELLPPRTPDHVTFGRDDQFNQEVRRRVDQYFARVRRKPRDCAQMYLKTAVVLGWLAASYTLLVFFAASWWMALPLVISLGLAMAAVGFNIQHDGGHHAYSDRPWINRLMARSLDLLGGSSFFWARKHNVLHHNYANISGHDDDIDLGILGRLSPHQRRLPFHRFQHYYLWALYGFLPMKWQLYDDFRDLITGQVGSRRFARPKGGDLAVFLGGKTLFFSLALVVPLLAHPLWAVLLAYLLVSLVEGTALSVVFQMAHCVEEAAFTLPAGDTHQIEASWAVHQVESTVDFARRNRLLSWFIGGLNFQIEHHLFPRICHVHYAAIAPLVEQTCREFRLKYSAHKSFRAGLVSHFRWLRQMGRPAAGLD